MDEGFANEVADELRRHAPPAGLPGAVHAAPHAAPHAASKSGAWPPGLPESLGRFCAVLASMNERLNLTGIDDARGMAVLHVLDSLAVAPLLTGASTVMDLGSGGGVPGIPLALALPEVTMTLVESRERKAAALSEMLAELQLSPRVTAAHARGELWLKDHTVDVVVARAVESLPDLLKHLRPVRRQFQRLILMKGPAADGELAQLGKRLDSLGFPQPVRHAAALPGDAGLRVLLEFDLGLARGAG